MRTRTPPSIICQEHDIASSIISNIRWLQIFYSIPSDRFFYHAENPKSETRKAPYSNWLFGIRDPVYLAVEKKRVETFTRMGGVCVAGDVMCQEL